jgi:hypothetical protein
MKRRRFLTGAAATALAVPAVHAAGDPKLLKFIPQADIALLDPHFAPALVTRNHAYMVYDTLYGVDDATRPRPQMAAGHVIEDDGKTWKITLREGLRFHDGQKVLARDAVASLQRWAKRDVFAISAFAQVDELSAISDTVLQFRLRRPFRLLADLLGKPNPFAPVIMPERLALTEPGQQVKEIIGSGPYRFVMSERVPGSLAVYRRNPEYVPRTDGPPSGTAGPKIAHFEGVEWHTIPDPGTAAGALQSGEMDWWEQATSDLLPLLRKSPDLIVDVIDMLGYYAVLRFNHLHPPFDNAGIRRALLGAFSQVDMMTAVAGDNGLHVGRRRGNLQSKIAPRQRCRDGVAERPARSCEGEARHRGRRLQRRKVRVPRADRPAGDQRDERSRRRGLPQTRHEHGLPDARLGNGRAAAEFPGTARQGRLESERELRAGLLGIQSRGARLPARPWPEVAVRLAGHAARGGAAHRVDRHNGPRGAEAHLP